jgi:glycosyltransferase involved in cell wall biosynthesis
MTLASPTLQPDTPSEVGKRRIRVLMGVPAPGATAGGTAVCIPMLLEDLRKERGIEVLTLPYGRWQEGEPLWLKAWHQFLDLFRYALRVRAAEADLVHLNTCLDRRALVRDAAFVCLGRFLGRRVLLQWHGSQMELLDSGSRGWRALNRMVLRNIDGLAVFSNVERDEVRRFRGAPPCFVVKNAVDLARYEQRADLRTGLGIAPDAPLLLFISRLIPTKGLEDTVRALPPVVAKYGAHLLVVGDGPSRGPAEALTRDLGLREHVHFFGAVPEAETARFYTGADVLVFPSTHPEGLPMVLIQSAAGGLGIVTTRLRAAVDYLREPDHCLYVAPNAADAVGQALDRLLSDRKLLQRMRLNNRTLAAHFGREQVAEEYGHIYMQIVDGCATGISGSTVVADPLQPGSLTRD